MGGRVLRSMGGGGGTAVHIMVLGGAVQGCCVGGWADHVLQGRAPTCRDRGAGVSVGAAEKVMDTVVEIV